MRTTGQRTGRWFDKIVRTELTCVGLEGDLNTGQDENHGGDNSVDLLSSQIRSRPHTANEEVADHQDSGPEDYEWSSAYLVD
jgi:hypothetical protein